MALKKVESISVTTTGAAGSAAGTTTTGYSYFGYIKAIKLNYHADAPATTDVTITTATAPAITICTATNAVTDIWRFPRIKVEDNAGTAQNQWVPTPIADMITVTVAQADALAGCVVVEIWLDEES